VILLLDLLIDSVMDTWSDIESSQFGIKSVGINSVAQEYKDKLVIGVNPEAGTRVP
jgi:hypothetical protein